MKTTIVITILLLASLAHAGDYNGSIYNQQNSPTNYQNSPYNYQNSPYNYQNSQYNQQRNSIYNNRGENVGYIVPKADGGANYYTNGGQRMGYTPPQRPAYGTGLQLPQRRYKNRY